MFTVDKIYYLVFVIVKVLALAIKTFTVHTDLSQTWVTLEKHLFATSLEPAWIDLRLYFSHDFTLLATWCYYLESDISVTSFATNLDFPARAFELKTKFTYYFLLHALQKSFLQG